MNTKSNSPHPVAQALREAGYIPVPRYWIKPSDKTAILAITDKHMEDVKAIRQRVYKEMGMAPPQRSKPVRKNPVDDKEAAWAAFERERENQ